MKIKALIKKLNPKVNIPVYKTTGSSGLDLEAFIKQDIIIKPNEENSNNFADAVSDYNATYGTNYSESEAKEALGM